MIRVNFGSWECIYTTHTLTHLCENIPLQLAGRVNKQFGNGYPKG
jgi:hypothetical protein